MAPHKSHDGPPVAQSHAPILGSGILTYPDIKEFQRQCKRFFANKAIPDGEQVGRIVFNFDSDSHQDWIDADLARLTALSFDDFMSEFKRKWLPTDWEDEIVETLISHQGSRPFWDWVVDVKKANTLLVGNDNHVEAAKLKAHILARISPPLRRALRSANLSGNLTLIADIDKWIDEVHNIDLDVQANKAEWVKLAKESVREAGLKSTNIANTTRNATVPPSSSSVPPPAFPRTPPLTDDQKLLLMEHNGCFRCRVFYADHISRSCTELRPSPDTLKNFSVATAEKAKADHLKKQAKIVAVVFGSGEATFADNDAHSSDHFTSDSDPEEGDEYVFSPPPISHFWWDCCIDGPLTCAPTPLRALIDHGAITALISCDTADLYGLRRRPLQEPLSVSGAFSKNRSDTPLVLTEFVKLHVQSPDAQWKARVVRAVVAPSLQTDLILGLEWLTANRIVVDAELRTCVAKDSGFDLMNPPDPVLARVPIKTSPADRRRAQAREFTSGRKQTKLLRVRVHQELRQLFDSDPSRFDFTPFTFGPKNIVALIRNRIETLSFRDTLKTLDTSFKHDFLDCFPTDIPHVRDLPKTVYHNIEVQPNSKITTARAYSCPRKYREGWKTLIDQHLAAGRIRPSSSPYTSPSFIVPKTDPSVLPRWVNDFRALNRVTVPDNYPLPRIDDILADCAKGSFWGKIDMTNSFFQTLVNPAHVKYTATLTPFGLWEWVVMPMGLRNSPATHQRRVTMALKAHIGRICHVYLDDIIIWSSSLEEHKANVSLVLEALRDAQLFCSMRKSQLFLEEVDFLGHHISRRGIEADVAKTEKILNWPTPRSAKDVRRFLGLVRYIGSFLPALAEHTSVLTPLTRKECNTIFPRWTALHQVAFEAVKSLVLSRECLTTIDHHTPGDNKIFVTCDASQRRTGAVLSFGPTWETARPVAFDSRQLRGPELHYPVHEQEMLAIMRAVTKWRTDLLGSHINIYTDHKTLENFDHQKDLSKRQARWMEYLSQYEYTITYINGDLNTVADALSRLPNRVDDFQIACSTFQVKSDPQFVEDIKTGYTVDKWCRGILSDLEKNLIDSKFGFSLTDGLLFIGSRLIIPKFSDLRENLFLLAHDNLGHFGGDKTYRSLRESFYWPNMRKDLVDAYIPSCPECQRNKSRTAKIPGPLHPLPIPDLRFDSVGIDFVGPLPKDEGFDTIVTMTCRLGADIQIAPCKSDMSAEEFALIFFDKWYCENGCPAEIISDRDKLFVSKFWRSLMKLAGISHKLSTSYHPQTDGSSERSNKTVVQCLRYHVERNQLGWVRALPKVRFDIMNTVNASTGFSPFHLKSAHSPRLIPSLISTSSIPTITVSPPNDPPSISADILSPDAISARRTLEQLETDLLDAKDSLVCAKISQAHQANKSRSPDPVFAVGDRVMLATAHRRRDYIRARDGRVAKFMPRFDGPYEILKAFPDSSLYTLRLPENSKLCPSFHASQLRPFLANNDDLFPHRRLARPGPIVTPSGSEEYFIDRILDERPRGRGKQYLVRWLGYGPDSDLWLPGRELADSEALDAWESRATASPSIPDS